MAVDSKIKRASVLHLIVPDGTIAQFDRQTVAEIYGGILAGAITLASGIVSVAFAVTHPSIAFAVTHPSIAFAVTYSKISMVGVGSDGTP